MKEYDPQMHTAEHILNGTIVKMFGCDRAFTTHIEKKKSKIDIHFDHPITDDDISKINETVNNVISKNLDVTEKFISRDEAKSKFNLDRLPKDAGDDLRVINVGDYDSCLCIGPHVSNTKEIGEFRITTADFNNGILRIRFKLKRPQ